MDDRELLELAARAAGIELLDFYGERYSARIIATNKLIGWNALTDDGDSLRLAVQLRLEIDIHHTGVAVRTPNGVKVLIDADNVADPYAATRRAIVEAAAAIAQEMTDE